MRSRTLLAAGGLLALVSAAPAFAQDSTTQAPPPDAVRASAEAAKQDSASAEPDVIVVTAQLREQRPIEVPYALTAYSGKFLDRYGILDFEDLARITPGFAVQNQSPNNPAISIRGITTDSLDAFFEPRVSIYQDGVSISKPAGAYVELFDIERVEISKGPQSTLYGRGALIGAVNIVQAKPQLDDTFGMVRGEFGNYDYRMAEGMLNVALSDKVGVRVAGRYKTREGYVENLLGGDDFQSIKTGAIRGSVRFAPSQDFTADIIANYEKDRPEGTAFKSLRFRPTDPVTGEVLGGLGIRDGAALAPGDGFEGGRDLGLDRKVWGVTGLLKGKIGAGLTLNSITAYRKFDAVETLDADGTSLPIITAGNNAFGKQFSQELRLNWDNGGPLKAFVGASYLNEDGRDRTPAQFDERTVLAQLAGVLNGGGFIPGRPASDPAPIGLLGNPAFTSLLLQGYAAQQGVLLDPALALAIAANLKPIHREEQTSFSRTKAFDIFGDVSAKVSDTVELGAGLRWSHDSKTSGVQAEILNGRSILGSFIGAFSLPAPQRDLFLQAIAVPGAANIPFDPVFYPIPVIGLTFQGTPGNDRVDEHFKDSGFTYRLFGRYAPSPDTSFYAIYARGRRPEVLSALPPGTPGGPARFTPASAETVDSFEVGAKTALINRTLNLDGAVYFYNYKNFQTVEQQGTIFITTNAGKARSYGFEAQARYTPSRWLNLFANYAFNHARFTTGVLDGNRLRLSPDHTFSAGGTLSTQAGPGRIEFSPSVTYQSKVFFDDDNDRPELQTRADGKLVPDLFQDEKQNGYALVSARLGNVLFDRYQIEAFVENALDKKYIKDAGNTGDALGLATFIPGEPRTYGVQLSVRF